MKTSVIEVRDMLSVWSVQGVEERIGDVPGVQSVTVNFSAGNATVRYDETRLDIGDIKADVRQRGYDAEAASAAAGGHGRHGHAATATSASKPEADSSKATAAKSAEPASAGATASGATGAHAPDKAAQPAAPSPVPEAATDHPAQGGGEKMSMP